MQLSKCVHTIGTYKYLFAYAYLQLIMLVYTYICTQKMHLPDPRLTFAV